MPFHYYDHAKEFEKIINRMLSESKIPGIVNVYKSERKCTFFYLYNDRIFELKSVNGTNLMEGSMECYTSDDILDQIEDIIIKNSYGLMIFP